MKTNTYDVAIVGGSYSGLAAAMALGRALRRVVVIDGGRPCNLQTPHSHNFLTQDGKPPGEIAMLARQQVQEYETVEFVSGVVTKGTRTEGGFELLTDGGEVYSSRKVTFATGIKDIFPNIDGFAECWGISVLHCPYCHGYEVRSAKTGVLGSGVGGFEFASLISNWTSDLTLFTDGPSDLAAEQVSRLSKHRIEVIEKEISSLQHRDGVLESILFKDGSGFPLNALYAPRPFEQSSAVPGELGCELTPEGYIKVDPTQATSIRGVFACGDNASRMRTLANAVATGTTAGMMANKELVLEEF